MKKLILSFLIVFNLGLILNAQIGCGEGTIVINGDNINAVLLENNNLQGLKLPLWLEAGSTVAAGNRVKLVSVIEFIEEPQASGVGNALVYNRVISVGTTPLTVPANHVWKVESLIKYENPFANGIATSSSSPICDGDNLNLTAATISGATYAWTGPNGFTSASQNPTINNATFTDAGVYYVSATLNGCSYTDSTTVVVNALPNSNFTNSYASAGFNVNFTPVVSGLTNYSWTFASGTPGTISAPIGVSLWGSTGSYNVTLVATDANGCSSSTTRAITVSNCQQNQPQSDFTWGPAVVGTNIAFMPNNTSANAYSWMFDQGIPNSSSVQSPTNISWGSTGTYDVTLETTFNGIGCYTTTKQITIRDGVIFTTCSETGRTGPTQGQCDTEYGGTPLSGNVTVNNGVQQWVVPQTGTYEIEVWGSEGQRANSNYVGGKGAKISAEFSLTSGSTLNIIVGQKGKQTGYGGGGGASAVWESGTPIIVAGGGGGGNSVINSHSGYDASTGENGVSSYAAGGTGGQGGSSVGQPQSGAGFFGDGSLGSAGISVPQALVNGGLGGMSYQNDYWGGFGGGGAGFGGGGGGGGYSGGGSGRYDDGNPAVAPGGGGGSYIAPSGSNASTSDGNYNGSSTFNGAAVGNIGTFNNSQGLVVIYF